MTEIIWEKPVVAEKKKNKSVGGRWKFLLGGVLMLGAVLYLVLSGTMVGARYFISVSNLLDSPAYVGQTVRITGAVIGDTIQYDPSSGQLDFTIAEIPEEYDDLATTLHLVASDPDATQLRIHMEGQVKADLMQHEAQAILTGQLGSDGVFNATEVLFKCPSRFQESVPGNLLHLTPDAATE